MKMEKNNDTGLMIQFILIFWVLVFSIITLIEQSFFMGMEILISLTLFVMAYNNHKVFKRKYLTLIYIVVALILLASLFIKL